MAEKKPIHKFNGGRGATLCHECNKIISEGMIEELYCEEHGGKRSYKYKLIREGDNKEITGNKILWVEWNEDGTYKQHSETPTVGASLVVDPHYGNYKWLTTTVTDILDQGEYIKFGTKNSVYKLYIY